MNSLMETICPKPQIPANNNADLITVHFEDYGQDFLEWDIDLKTERVVASRPFQNEIWSGLLIAMPSMLKIGEKILCTRDMITANEIKYPITKIERKVKK